MATVLACDSVFDMSCYGGILEEQEKEWQIHIRDGIRRRFHYIDVDSKFHIVLEQGQFAKSRSVVVDKEINVIATRGCAPSMGSVPYICKGQILLDFE